VDLSLSTPGPRASTRLRQPASRNSRSPVCLMNLPTPWQPREIISWSTTIIPATTETIPSVRRLREAGFEALWAGGVCLVTGVAMRRTVNKRPIIREPSASRLPQMASSVQAPGGKKKENLW